MEAIDVPEHLLNYFDYEAYGRDIRLEEDGHFVPGGYVLNNGGQFIEHYHGIEDIPDEHKVFAFPQLTEERRKELTKQVKKYGENGKVAIRNIRRDAMDKFKAMKKSGELTEDDLKAIEKETQDLTDKYCKQIDEMAAAKSKEILEI